VDQLSGCDAGEYSDNRQCSNAKAESDDYAARAETNKFEYLAPVGPPVVPQNG
jgi:hypothetical protein